MSDNRYPALIFSLAVFVSLILPLFYYFLLPETIASHFNFYNKADAWMSKKTFFIIQISVMIFLPAMFLSFIYIIPKLPKSIINLPNKEYWLSDERKDKSIGIFQRFLFWFGSMTITFLTIVFQQVYYVNIKGVNTINSIVWFAFVFYLLGTIFIVVKMILHFKNIKE